MHGPPARASSRSSASRTNDGLIMFNGLRRPAAYALIARLVATTSNRAGQGYGMGGTLRLRLRYCINTGSDSYQPPSATGMSEVQVFPPSYVPVVQQPPPPAPLLSATPQVPAQFGASQLPIYAIIPQQVEKNTATVTEFIEENIRTVQQAVFGRPQDANSDHVKQAQAGAAAGHQQGRCGGETPDRATTLRGRPDRRRHRCKGRRIAAAG